MKKQKQPGYQFRDGSAVTCEPTSWACTCEHFKSGRGLCWHIRKAVHYWNEDREMERHLAAGRAG